MIPRRHWLIGMGALFVIALAGYGLLVPSTSPPAATPPATAGLLAALEETLEHIYTQVNPSVVNVQVEQRQVVRFPIRPESRGFLFHRSPRCTRSSCVLLSATWPSGHRCGLPS
jgi:hypothetical protein